MKRELFLKMKVIGAMGIISVMFFVLFSNSVTSYTEQIPEVPEKVYNGIENTSVILKNIDFNDVRLSGTWAKEAIYEVGAFDIIKGYGDRIFGRTNQVSKEQALAIIYRAVGMEQEAQLAAEGLDNLRAVENRKTYALSMWSDGYLQLAANQGLISQNDFNDAILINDEEPVEISFYRGASAQRQDVAYWLALALGIQPVYGQQKIFNSYNDWTSADPHKVPYIEAVLSNGIMNGEDNGYFKPTGYVTREQMAQIIKNAFPIILPLLGYEKKIGTIEDIQNAQDYTNGMQTLINTINVRNSNGKLHKIITQIIDNRFEGYKNEQKGSSNTMPDMDLIVYKGGKIGNSSLLKSGDRMEYIVSQDDRVTFVKVISNVGDTKYIVARINKVDTANSTLNVSKIFDIDYPDIDVESRNFSFDMTGKDVDITCVYSDNVEVIIDGIKSDITNIKPGTDAILALKGNIVEAIKTIELRLKEQGVVNGIVEDNNPYLGYISLFNEEGEKYEDNSETSLSLIRIYNYVNPKNIIAYKNGKDASIEDITAGDSVFIKLDDEGNIEKISAVDNFILRYAKVMSKSPEVLSVKYDDGGYQLLEVGEDIPVILDGLVVGYGEIKDGDRVKLLLNITDKFTKIKEIKIEGSEHFITNIYKGIVSKLDDISNKLVLQNLEVLKNGKWMKTDQKGFAALSLSEENTILHNNVSVDVDTANKLLKNYEAYIAVENDYGGDEKVVFVSIKGIDDVEAAVFDDSISSNGTGNAGEFSLEKEYKNIAYNDATIIIKKGRLVSGGSIGENDEAYVVANRDYNGDYYASVVEINERSDPNFIKIYRGRISDINENMDFTVGSFSEIDGQKWEYYNTPKSFRIISNTKILDEEGVIGQRNFTDIGETSFKDRPVYVLSKGIDAELISTAPYGNVFAKGEIYEIVGDEDEGEEAAGEEAEGPGTDGGPTGITLINAKIYDTVDYIWKNSDDIVLDFLSNSIILKNNSIVKPSELEKGDIIRVVKKDSNDTGDAYIIIVE